VLGLSSLGDWLGLLATSIFASAQVSGDTAKGLAFGGVIAVRLLLALVLGPVATSAGPGAHVSVVTFTAVAF
jgi:dTMP kinase